MLGTCCLPWDEDGAFLENVFRAGVRTLVRGGLRDLYVFGTAGEGYAVTDALFDRVVRVFVEEATDLGVPPMVGVISLSLPTVVERIERAANLGVRRFQLSLSSWGTLTDGEVAVFFRETCGRFPELRFLHYNLPRAGRLLSGRQYAELAAAHPNLVATKYGGADLRLIADLLSEAPRLRHFFTELGYAAGCALGAPGLLVSFASSGLHRARAFFDAGVQRDLPALAALQRELLEVRAALAAAVGPGPHMDGAFDKLISRLQVPDFPLRLLPPYAGAGEAAFATARRWRRASPPGWTLPRHPGRASPRRRATPNIRSARSTGRTAHRAVPRHVAGSQGRPVGAALRPRA
jgi:dihydrodipicolinate synthase/N-acetylneuraminate lyase